MTAPAAHARLAPSSADRWVGCPASPAMESQHPEDEESEASRDGTAAHWALEQLLAGVPPRGLLATAAPNGVPIRQDMIDGAMLLVDDIRPTQAAAAGIAIRIEERVDAASLIHPDNWGTPDVYMVDRARRVLHVWDFKFGHRYVDAYQNWQLVDYAACIMESEGLAHELGDWSYTFTICQPRNYSPEGPLRLWDAPGREVAHLVERLRIAAAAASAPAAQCRTGDHCRDCRAQWDCLANQRAGGASVDLAYRAQSTGMNAAELGLEGRVLRQALARLKARVDALDERILGLIRNGQTVPHHKLDWTKPREVWREGEAATVASIGDMLGVDLRKGDVPLVTPKQAIAAGIDETVIRAYSTTPAASPKLVQSDESDAARIFGNR